VGGVYIIWTPREPPFGVQTYPSIMSLKAPHVVFLMVTMDDRWFVAIVSFSFPSFLSST
jgi:hypothetical protein